MQNLIQSQKLRNQNLDKSLESNLKIIEKNEIDILYNKEFQSEFDPKKLKHYINQEEK